MRQASPDISAATFVIFGRSQDLAVLLHGLPAVTVPGCMMGWAAIACSTPGLHPLRLDPAMVADPAH
jgi:hypothetical protein